MNTRGRSLELFFVDGNPEGMLTAEVFNWTGHVLRIPRQQIAEGLKRAEASFTGVYLLLGERQDGGPFAYIGESEDVASRLRQHDVKKDWWTRVVIITSAANNLHKAHVKYLESRLVERAREVANTELENANTPPRSSLSEAARANMESFLDTLNTVLPAIRVDMFLERARRDLGNAPVAIGPGPAPVQFQLVSPRVGLSAHALLQEGEFVVQAGSTARAEWAGVDYATYRQLYVELRASGVLLPLGDLCIFAKNYAFPSASAASSVVLGRSSSGPKEWRHVPSGKSYKDWEAQLLNEQEPSPHE
ncbi:protein of unknown function [Gemmobacter aquatilis]|uniref:DUF4357 domain-containing protein n=1 Tax=Gemmobacter aquatilis TaxID=933059 RepID=A0A1H7Z848_9RHOB|nr:GIY-YIG nuclease family protein [Gemmobacter aquatilis]SEM54435.1 protein of unknown function [Gemmobacter aquatilis]